MVNTESLKSYFEKARRFDQDRLIQLERSARIAWFVAICASVIAAVSVFAIAGLTPLKTVEPFVVRVDNSTGIVDVVSALTSTAGTYDEAVTKYFAARYVRAREGYVSSEAEDNFKTVALLSTQPEQSRFAATVRYMRTVTRGEDVRTTHWVATLTFSYVNAPMSSTDRLVNPLGFVVSDYRADPEAIN
jgi:type IV secretion system protein VirB8